MLTSVKTRSSLYALILVAMVASIAIAYATTPPKVSFLSPNNGATIGGEVKLVVAFSSAAEQPVVKVELYVDRQLVEETPLNPPVLSGEQTYFLDTLRLGNGPHSLIAKVYRGPDDIGECAITVYINNAGEDVTPPLVEILYPKEQEKVRGKVEVQIKAQDDKEVKYVMLFINDKFKFLKNYPPFNDIWDTTRYPNGPNILQAFAYDGGENRGESKPVKVIVDNPTGQTTLGEEKVAAVEEIAPPSLITPPPTPRKERGEGLTAAAKEEGNLLEASKETQPEVSLPPSQGRTVPPMGKGQAVVVPGSAPKEAAGIGTTEEEKIALTLTLPKQVTVPSTSTKGQAAIAGGTAPKEAVKDGQEKTEKRGGVPVLPPLAGQAQAKGISPAPLTAEKSFSLPPAQKTSFAKGRNSPEEETTLDKQNSLLVVSKPEESLRLVSQGTFISGNNPKVHTIKKGECLLKIASAYGVPLDTLMSVNNISNPNLIIEGEKLLIPNVTVLYNDNEVLFPDARPFVQNELPLLPFRAVFETAGGTVIWHPDSREVEAHKGDKSVWLKIGSKKAQVDEQTILMEVAAFIKFNRTYVPATFFHYALGAEVRWDPQTGSLYISAP